MNMKRISVFLLTAAMLLSLAFCGTGAAWAEDPDIDAQLSLISSKLDALLQPNGELTWYYSVTDLDHNGRLEFIAAAQHPQDRSTNLRVWEVSTDGSALTECSLTKDPEESFPDILTDTADTYYDTVSGGWYYLFYDNVVLSANEVYTSKSAYHMTSGVISYTAYAVEHTVVENGYRNVTHTDSNGIAISAEQYNAAGANVFAGSQRSSTNFDWFKVEDAAKLSRLADSYAVFTGRKAPTEVFPVPKPEALQKPEATPNPQPVYLSVTKNPTNENRTEGDTAWFVSCANAYESLSWTLVSPNGGEYSVSSFRSVFPQASVGGEFSTTLSIENTSTDMNNWGAYCTFFYKGQTARTSTAYMYISAKPQPRPIPSGTYAGTVTDWSYNTVSVSVEDKVTVPISYSLCDIDGDLYVGASAQVVWDGQRITWCHIDGEHWVGPIYGSMSGTIYSDSAYTVYVVLQDGTGLHLDASLVNWVSGSVLDGAACTVYYQNYPSEEYVYQIDVYGYEPEPQPTYGSMGGYAYEGGGGYAIYLDNGTQVYIDSWLCNVTGYFVDGSPCTVYFNGTPTPDGIFQVDIYGSYDQPVIDFDDGLEPYYGPGDYEPHEAYNDDGSTYNTVTCSSCGREVSMAFEACPYCGYNIWG